MQRVSVIGSRLAVFAAASLLGIATLTQPAASQSSQEKTLAGVVSDSMCGAAHMMKNKTAAECARLCAKQGQKYALVVGQKVYTLEGHEAELENWLAHAPR